MQVSKRLFELETESAFAILAKAKKLEQEGKDIINLGIGQPDFKTPNNILEAAKKRNLLAGLQLIQKDFPNVIELVRGKGLMLGIKCKVQNTDFVENARRNKLLSVKASDNVVRLMPPLILSLKESNEGLEKIRSTCESF